MNDTDASDSHAYVWTTDRGFDHAADAEEIVRLSRLTAYAEHGEAALEADEIHHTIHADDPAGGQVRIDAPRFLLPLDSGEHRRLHNGDGEWRMIDGIPEFRPADADATATDATDAEDVAHAHAEG